MKRNKMTISEENVNQDLSNVDLSKIQCLQQKRTLAFVNHFVLTNVQFLNNFMRNCEHKLMQFERKLEKVNASMVLLEAKLSSIPELDVDIPPNKDPVKDKLQEDKLIETTAEEMMLVSEELKVEESSRPEVRPEYDRFIKMVQVGVPIQAVKIKVKLEGLDPELFENILSK